MSKASQSPVLIQQFPSSLIEDNEWPATLQLQKFVVSVKPEMSTSSETYVAEKNRSPWQRWKRAIYSRKHRILEPTVLEVRLKNARKHETHTQSRH